MARGATIYKFSLDIANVDAGVYEKTRLTVARHPSENDTRLVARLIAFALCYEADLAFGRGVSSVEEPDVWSREGDGRVRQWVEVGQPSAKRVVRASRRAESISVFAFGPGFRPWWEPMLVELEGLTNLIVWRLDDRFLDGLAAGLERSNDWSLTLSGDQLFVEAKGSDSQQSELVCLLGSDRLAAIRG